MLGNKIMSNQDTTLIPLCEEMLQSHLVILPELAIRLPSGGRKRKYREKQ